MSNVYFCSDPHYHHKNIVKGISNWDDISGCRPFNTIEEHNQTIVNGINNVVDKDDTLYCLGDWSFGGIDKIWEFRKQINCHNIHLILGNHDHHIENNRTLRIPITDGYILEKNFIVSGVNEYIMEFNYNKGINEYLVPCHNLFSSVQHVKTITIEGHTLFLSHYAHRVWNKSHKGRIHLYGHSHDTLPEYGMSMDVGFDAAYHLLGEWRPFSFQEIQKIMSNCSIKFVDHHDSNTTE